MLTNITLVQQKTIITEQTLFGIGLHTGQEIQMKISPLKSNSGIIFKRSDLSSNNFIKACYDNVRNTKLCTQISNDHGVSIATIEHLMSALWGMEIDNLLIEVNAPEIPVMDGSANDFVDLIKKAGVVEQSHKKRLLKILRDVKIADDDKYISVTKNTDFALDFTIDFSHQSIGRQSLSCHNEKEFESNIARARTFGFLDDVQYLRDKGLAVGASLSNTVVLDDDHVMNTDGLRYNNEFVRHKILDCIGDIYLCGYKIIGNIKAYKAGHKMNNDLVRKLFSNPSNFRII